MCISIFTALGTILVVILSPDPRSNQETQTNHHTDMPHNMNFVLTHAAPDQMGAFMVCTLLFIYFKTSCKFM